MIKENLLSQKVVKYFETWESRLGYDLITFGAKHFGYYPNGQPDISEKKAQELMQDLLIQKLKLKSSDRVLDAGCGQGVVGCYLAQKISCLVEGITIVPFEADRANRLAQKLGLYERVHFQVMDYVNPIFSDPSFDAIYTMESLVHSHNLQKTLGEFYRLLKPDGLLVNFEYSIASDSEFVKYPKESKVLDWVIEKSGMFALREMRHGQLIKILEQTGFINVQEDNITNQMKPSVARLEKLARVPYFFIKLLNLQDHFINATTATTLFPFILKTDIFHYNITTAQKP